MRKRLTTLILAGMLLLFSTINVLGENTRTADPDEMSRALDAMLDCCFSPEYGADCACLIRWEESLRVCVLGEPTEKDMEKLTDYIACLTEQVDNLPGISLVQTPDDANVTVSFVPYTQMKYYADHYADGNLGFVSWRWKNHCIYDMRVVIASDVTTQEVRNHLIMEEFTQGLGVQDDLDAYPDSIFYRQWTTVQQPSRMDIIILNLLYDPRVRPGMTGEMCFRALAD